MNECMSEILNVCLNEWMNELINDWIYGAEVLNQNMVILITVIIIYY